jgi:hypothetical protein
MLPSRKLSAITLLSRLPMMLLLPYAAVTGHQVALQSMGRTSHAPDISLPPPHFPKALTALRRCTTPTDTPPVYLTANFPLGVTLAGPSDTSTTLLHVSRSFDALLRSPDLLDHRRAA